MSNMDMYISNIMRLGALPKKTDVEIVPWNPMGFHVPKGSKTLIETCDPWGHILTPWNHEK